jgi:hypothetical protein
MARVRRSGRRRKEIERFRRGEEMGRVRRSGRRGEKWEE